MPTPFILTPENAAAYLAIRQEMLTTTPWAFLSDPSDDIASGIDAVRQMLASNENDVLAIQSPDSDGTLISVAGVYRELKLKARHRAHIWGVYTSPKFRCCGYSRAVMLAAINHTRSWQGVQTLSLSVSNGAPEALNLYESMGFTNWGHEPDALRIKAKSYDEIHLSLKL